MTETKVWIEKILQQLAAESYLDNLHGLGSAAYDELLQERLRFGANNYRLYSDDPAIKGILINPAENPDGTIDPRKEHATRMLSGQAEDFVNKFEIVHHLANRSSGFSATLTRKHESGELTLSFRSTEFRPEINGGDTRRDAISGADGEIFKHGFALGQLMQMQDYYQYLLDNGYLASDSKIDVTGYSLGGQLASAFTLLHPQQVNQAYVFNGVGLGDFNQDAGSLEQMIADYKTALLANAQATGETLNADIHDIVAEVQLAPTAENALPNLYHSDSHRAASQAIWDAYATEGTGPLPHQTDTLDSLPAEISAKITQLYGRASHNDTEVVANQGINSSNMHSVFIEDQPNWIKDGGFLGLGGDAGDTHSMILLLDSLLLTDTLQMLDPAVTRQQLEQVYAAAYAEQVDQFSLFNPEPLVDSNSLEYVLDAVRRVFYGEDMQETLTGDYTDAFGMVGFRQDFYNNLSQLQATINNWQAQGVEFSFRPLHQADADSLLQQALDPQHGLAYRYALLRLNPFALEASDVVYAVSHDLQALSLFDSVSASGQLSEAYLRDRAEMLAVKNQVAMGDLHDNRVSGFDDRDYRLGSDTVYHVDTDGIYQRQQVIFADGSEQQLLGSRWDDRLYGSLAGHEEILEGGRGDDYLEGGQGHDVYRYEDGDGFDRVFDSDGVGALDYDGNRLKGARRIAEGLYRSEQDNVVYSLLAEENAADRLLVNRAVLLENFNRDGYLGLQLDEALAQPGQDLLSVPGNDDNDILVADGQASYLDAGAGHDWLNAAAGDDWLQGGSGDDWLIAGDGDDRLYAGKDTDLLLTGTGSNIADGGSGHDVLLADRSLLYLSSEADRALAQRLWLDLAGHWQMNASSQTVLLDDDNQIGVQLDIALSDMPAEGLSHDGQMRYRYDDQTQTMRYFDLQDELIVSLPLQLNMQTFANTQRQLLSGGDGNDVIIANQGDDYLHGGAGNDRLQGRDGDDLLAAGAGGDWLLGNAGDDLLDAGSDNDWLYGGAGRDRLLGGAGNDRLFGDNPLLAPEKQQADRLFGGDGKDELYGNGGADYLDGGRDNDVLFGEDGADRLYGRHGDDELMGGAGDDGLFAGSGDDRLYGEAGYDWLEGGSGDDRLFGGAGNDVLVGGTGNDRLRGQQGMDTYLFNPGDGDDKIVDGSTGNTLRFGHGINRASLQVHEQAGEHGGKDLLIRYAADDQLRIVNYEGRFTHVEYADQGNSPLAFSTLLQPYVPPLIDSQPSGLVQQPVINDSETLAFDPLRQAAEQEAFEHVQRDFVAAMQESISDGLAQNGFTRIADNLFERAPQQDGNRQTWLQAQISLETYRLESADSPMGYMSGYQRSSGDVSGQTIDSWQGFTTQMETIAYDITLDSSWQYAVREADGSLDMQAYEGIGLIEGIRPGSRYSYRSVETSQMITSTREMATINQLHLLGDAQDNLIKLGDTHFNQVLAGAGDDVVRGDVRSNRFAGAGFAGTRIDWPWGSEYSLSLTGNFLDGGAGDDRLEGSALRDVLIGGSGDDVLLAGAGNDRYYASQYNGHDLVFDNGWHSNAHNREDVIVLPEGVLFDDLQLSLDERLFNAPVTWQTAQTELASLHQHVKLQWNEHSSISVVLPHSDFDAGLGIDFIEQADGQRVALQTLLNESGLSVNNDPHLEANHLNAAVSFTGGEGDDVLSLNSFNLGNDTHQQQFQGRLMPMARDQLSPIQTLWPNRSPERIGYLAGGQGYDQLTGGDGDDFLVGGEVHQHRGDSSMEYWGTLDDEGNRFEGGAGNDVIWATAGDDVFHYAAGDGHDMVTDKLKGFDFPFDFDWRPQFEGAVLQRYNAGSDTLVFAEGIQRSDVSVRQQDDHLVFDINHGEGSILFYNWHDRQYNQLQQVSFADGSHWNALQIDRLAQGLPLNSAPQVAEQIADRQFANNQSITWQFSSAVFSDADSDDSLEYSLSQADGSALPDWLTFDSEQLTLSSLGYDLPAGDYALRLQATDTFGESASQEFSLKLDEHYASVEQHAFMPVSIGGSGSERLLGDDNNNWLLGAGGDDLLRGNAGNDLLYGGSGDDVYLFRQGDGEDWLYDSGGDDRLVFEDSLLHQLQFSHSLFHLDIGYENTDDRVRLPRFGGALPAGIEQLELADQLALDLQQLDNLVAAMAGFNGNLGGAEIASALQRDDPLVTSLVVNAAADVYS